MSDREMERTGLNIGQCEVFEYSYADIGHMTSPLISSDFENLLKARWSGKMDQGLFRYTLEGIQTREIPGQYGFIARLNILRGTNRREPEYVTSLTMPFHPERFHFLNVNQREVIFLIRNIQWREQRDERKDLEGNHAFIINVSPIEPHHSVFCPFIDLRLPQVLTFKAILLAVEVMLSARNSNFRMGYNSLAGNASVNHLHFHAYNLPKRIQLEWTFCLNLAGDLFITLDYPAQAFAFETHDDDEENWVPLARNVWKLVEYLLEKRVPHNILLTHAQRFNDCQPDNDYLLNSLRVYVWPRLSNFGRKKEEETNIAICEFAGHWPIKNKKFYETVTEEKMSKLMEHENSYWMNMISADVLELFSEKV